MRVLPINNNSSSYRISPKNKNFQGKLTPQKIIKSDSSLTKLLKSSSTLVKTSLKYIASTINFGLKALAVISIFLLPAHLGNLRKTHKEYPQVKPLIKEFSTQESALNYSIARITEQLNGDSPREYSVNINNNKHRIISEALGKESVVCNYAPFRMLYNVVTTPDFSYTTMHGHPAQEDGSTTTFSFKDFEGFISQDGCDTDYVVNKDGKYCRMVKTENYRKPTKEEMAELKSKFDFYLNAAWPTSKTVINNKGEVVFQITDYPGMHDYWDFTTKKFGIKYFTTYGTYGLYNDIYKDGYHEGFDKKVEVLKY